MSARLDRLFAQKQRDLFLPLSFRFSAKLEQMDWDEIKEDPVYTAFALRNGQKLFQADGVINWFDTCLEAEAAGVEVERDETGEVIRQISSLDLLPDSDSFLQQGDIPLALDVARRLCDETLDESAVLGYLTGLHTLIGRLFGEDRRDALLQSMAAGEMAKENRDVLNGSVQLSLQLARAYCEMGVGGLLFAEEDQAGDFGYLRLLEPVFNVANYYGMPLMLLCRRPLSYGQKREALQAGFQYVLAPDEGAPEENDVARLIPAELLIEEGALDSWVQEQRNTAGGAWIYVSEWELPLETVPEALVNAGRLLCE